MLLRYFSALLVLCTSVYAFTNPIKSKDGSDPYMVYNGGYYYLTTTTWSNIQITRATTVGGLKTATPKVVWTDTTAARCCNMWAPEIHYVSGAWYIYYSAGTSTTANFDNQRGYALKGSSNDIWASTWTFQSRLVIPNRDVWAIDWTVLFLPSGNYFVFSSWDGSLQCLWIAKQTSATTMGNAVEISCPTNSWETVGGSTNEGPAAIYHGGRTWIIYSASSCAGSGYSLGQMELTGTDPLSKSSWTKYNTRAVFTGANGQNGVGHNGFFTAANGVIWMVYHFSPGTVYCDGSRETAVEPVGWHTDGSPNFGTPLALSTNLAEPSA